MKTIYEKYTAFPIDKGLLSLEPGDIADPYFCYPVNAKPIGFEGSILYCFLPEYGDMVFACNPESCADRYVYPLAESFEDFIRLVTACGSANPVEQIIWMSKKQFEQHLQNEKAARTEAHTELMEKLCEGLQLSPMDNPYAYVKALQISFDDSKIQYSDAYYDVLGLER